MSRHARRSILIVIVLGLGLLGAGAVWAVAQPGDVPVTLNEDEANHAITLTSTTTDTSATSVDWEVTGGPTHGSLDATSGTLDCTAGDCQADVHYTPDLNYNGSDGFTYRVQDVDGWSAQDGTVSITVDAVNDPPTFTGGGDVTVDEDSGAHTEPGWATGMSAGPADESGQALDFQVSSNNPSLFAAGPAVDATTGDLTFTPAPNANGSATVGVKLHDDGGGTDLSTEQTLLITVNAVNDAPSFVAGPDVVVNENSSAYSATGWATGLSSGPANESGQALTFSFPSDDNSALFSAGPAVSPSGDLTFTPAAGQSGTAHLTLQVMDDDGTALGGVDTSATQAVTIRVNAPPSAVGDSVHVAENSPGTHLDVLANDTSLPDPPETLTITAVTQPGHGKVVIDAGGGSVTYTPTPLYYGQGSDYFMYTISDGYATDQATVIISIDKDTTGPTVTSVAQGLRTAVTMTSTTLPGKVTWAGNDGAGVGIDHYTLQRSTNGGSWSGLSLPSKTSTSLNVAFSFGSKYRFRVHAVDRNGNVGAWTYTPTFTEGRYQETSSYIKYSGYWAPTSNVNDSGGAAKYTTVAGRYALITKTMRDVAFVSPMSSTRGSVKVYVDGTYVKTISLKRSTTAYRQVMWTMHFATSGSHSVKLVVVGNGRVDLDCFVTLY